MWHIVGLAAARIGKLDEGARALTRASQIDEESAAVWTDLSNVLRQSGDIEGAVAAGRKAVARDPSLAAAHNNLGVALRQAGDFEDAVEALTEAATLAPGVAEIHNNLGNSLKSAMRYDDAIAAYKTATDLRPAYAEAMANLGAVLISRQTLGTTPLNGVAKLLLWTPYWPTLIETSGRPSIGRATLQTPKSLLRLPPRLRPTTAWPASSLLWSSLNWITLTARPRFFSTG